MAFRHKVADQAVAVLLSRVFGSPLAGIQLEPDPDFIKISFFYLLFNEIMHILNQMKKTPLLPDVTNYTDYRKFLYDYYRERKKEDPDFTFMMFSAFSGLKSKGFLHNVIQGKRNLNGSHIAGLLKSLKFKTFERTYFEALVRFNQETDAALRKKHFNALSGIKSRGKRPWECQVLRKDQYEFYSKYHHSVIRSLIGLSGFNGDYPRLAKMVYPKIALRQAKLSVRLLLRLGLIKKTRGSYAITDKSISTPPEIESVAVLDFHRQTLDLALKALTSLPKSRRYFSSATLGLSPSGYRKMCEEIEASRFRQLEIAENDSGGGEVYQLNYQLVPVSRIHVKRGRQK
jgi:uncharacterized protein (TIGR02147 family)